jgi:hypothetical protein
MSEARNRRCLPIGESAPTRLATQYERRQTGVGFDDFGQLTPVYKTYHVGHGQQLARKREAARAAEMRSA